MNCDLCGQNGELCSALIENSLMSVCKKCLSFGKKVERNKNFNVNEIISKRYYKEGKITLLKENYSNLIKEGREKLKLSQEDIANKLNEKVSLIKKVENREIIPNENLIKKLENFFKINLQESYEEDKNLNVNLQSKVLTIGDLIKIKKFKK